MGGLWKNAGRQASNSQRGAAIQKLAKEIMVAARNGDPDPAINSRLRAAIEAAKKNDVTRETIERSIKKGAGLLDGPLNYDTLSYEGFAPHKVPVIVECLTDNKNRTISNVRSLFKKGQLGAPGAVAWMFDRLGMIEAIHKTPGLDFESAAIEAGAQEVEALEAEEVKEGTGARFYTDIADLDAVNKALSEAGWVVSVSELTFRAKSYPELSPEETADVQKFLRDMDDDDDVHRVYAAMK